MTGERMKLSGFDELKRNLAALDYDVQTKMGRTAAAAGAYVIVREARRLVKSGSFTKVEKGPDGARTETAKTGLVLTRALLENIAAKRERNPTPGTVRFSVGVRHGKKAKNARKSVTYSGTKKSVSYENDPFYWFMLEFGTSKMKAKPFLRPAFEGQKEKAVNTIAQRLRRNLERYKAKNR